MNEYDERSQDALQYQWYADYSRADEYRKDPEWTRSIRQKVIEVESEDDDYQLDKVRFYDRFDPKNVWIESDTVYNLFNMC